MGFHEQEPLRLNIIDKLNQQILEASANFDYEKVRELQEKINLQVDKNKI